MMIDAEEPPQAERDYTQILRSEVGAEVARIKAKYDNFQFLWNMYSLVDKVLVIVQFGTLLYSVIVPENNYIGLTLSMYTLSFSVICKFQAHLITLEKLIPTYEGTIIPEMEDFLRKNALNDSFDFWQGAVSVLLDIEQRGLQVNMGRGFTLSNTLRSINCKKILCCIIIYIVFFIFIPILLYLPQHKG